MPVKTRGKRIIEKSTGVVVARASSVTNAKASARIRNEAHAKKHGRKRKRGK